uniref:Uncharacterized protein n=1 Tax=Anguilla anguilla TaxID=7936 RepID=A0A0E9V9N8_ANGAN
MAVSCVSVSSMTLRTELSCHGFLHMQYIRFNILSD